MKNMTESEYRQLVEEYSDMVTRLCVVHTGNFSDAEDCYQNVFFKLFKQINTIPIFRGKSENKVKYLYVAAVL